MANRDLLPALDDSAQFDSHRCELFADCRVKGLFAEEQKLALSRENGAARKIESAESACEFMGCGMRALALRSRELFAGAAGRRSGFEQAYATANLRQKADPELVESHRKIGSRSPRGSVITIGLCRGFHTGWHRYFHPNTPEI